MAAIPYELIVSSGLFEFLVGPLKRKFSMHSALIAAQSPSLEKLVNGNMKEALEQRVEWEETDETTFSLFSQFAYTGDYEKKQCLLLDREVEPKEEGLHKSKIKDKKKKKRPSTAFEYPEPDECWPGTFDEATSSTMRRFISQCPDRLCDHNTDSWSGDIKAPLIHARLYTFADYHGIKGLQTLTLCKLHQTLVQFELGSENASALVELAQYTYEHTLPDRNDPLRSMVIQYVTCKTPRLWESQDFRLLVRMGGDFAADLVGQILKESRLK